MSSTTTSWATVTTTKLPFRLVSAQDTAPERRVDVTVDDGGIFRMRWLALSVNVRLTCRTGALP